VIALAWIAAPFFRYHRNLGYISIAYLLNTVRKGKFGKLIFTDLLVAFGLWYKTCLQMIFWLLYWWQES